MRRAALAVAVLGAGLLATPASAADATGTVAPRVSPVGTTVTASGSGCADAPSITVRVVAAATGWYDVPPTYATRTTTTRSDGTWRVTFPMPGGVATVSATCGASTRELGTLAPVPSGGHYPAPTKVGDRYVVSSAERPEVFGPDGTPVPTSPVAGDPTAVSFAAHDLPARVVALGVVDFGENADARQVRAPRATTYDIPAAAQLQPAASPTPSPRPTRSGQGEEGGAGELPSTGAPLAVLVALGLAASIVGAGLVRRT
jgi:LPXTG-motif cell wall-anchored protein